MELQDFFLSEFKAAAQAGLKLQGDGNVVKGFTLSLTEKNVHHDFTQEAIAEALCRMVRPNLAEIVRSAIK